jgi:hypothetical protein
VQKSDDPVADAISGATISLVAAGLPMGPWSPQATAKHVRRLTCNTESVATRSAVFERLTVSPLIEPLSSLTGIFNEHVRLNAALTSDREVGGSNSSRRTRVLAFCRPYVVLPASNLG